MYLGRATLYQDRINEFFNVAKSLEVKEISKDVDCNATDASQKPEYVESIKETTVERDQIEYKDRKSENGHKQQFQIQSTMGGKRHYCDRCEKSYSLKTDLKRHIQSFHEGVKFQCNLCGYECAHEVTLYQHKRNKH